MMPELQPFRMAAGLPIVAARDGRGHFVLAWIEARMGVTPEQLRSARRLNEWVEARMLAAWALSHLGRPWTMARIGRWLASNNTRRGTSSVKYWLRRADELRAMDAEFDRRCAEIVADYSMENRHVS